MDGDFKELRADTIRAGTIHARCVAVEDERGRPRIVMQADETNCTIVLFDSRGRCRADVSVTYDDVTGGAAVVSVGDCRGRCRLGIGQWDNQPPKLFCFDEEGNPGTPLLLFAPDEAGEPGDDWE